MAQHYTAAGLDESAVSYWYTAGRNASERSAYVEAIGHCTQGLNLLGTLPNTPERAQQELDFHLPLGVSLLAVKGYGAPEVEQNYLRARELCRKAGEASQHFLVLQGLWNCYLLREELPTAQALADQLLGLAQRSQEPALIVGGQQSARHHLVLPGAVS